MNHSTLNLHPADTAACNACAADAEACARRGGRHIECGGPAAPLEGLGLPLAPDAAEFPEIERARAWYNSSEEARASRICAAISAPRQ